MAGLPVAARVARVRPWKPPRVATMPVACSPRLARPQRLATLMAASLASAPGVGQEHLGVAADVADQALGQLDLGAGEVEVGGVAEGAELGADRLDDPRVGVAGRDHRDPAKEVQVLAAAGVPQPHPLAPDELDLGPHVGRPQHRRLALGQAAHDASSSSAGDHGPDPGVGEQLQQQGVLAPAVQDVGPADPAPQGGHDPGQLGHHPGRDLAPGQDRLAPRPPSAARAASRGRPGRRTGPRRRSGRPASRPRGPRPGSRRRRRR